MPKLTPVQEYSLEFDRKVLKDMGLRMPRLTKKYVSAVFVLSDLYFTSACFLHVMAAQRGRRYIYKDMEQHGYVWNTRRQAWKNKSKSKKEKTV